MNYSYNSAARSITLLSRLKTSNVQTLTEVLSYSGVKSLPFSLNSRDTNISKNFELSQILSLDAVRRYY